YHELISHIANNESNEDKALKETIDFFGCIDLSEQVGLPVYVDMKTMDVIYGPEAKIWVQYWFKTFGANAMSGAPLWMSLMMAHQYTDGAGNITQQPDLNEYGNPEAVLYCGQQGPYWNDQELWETIKASNLRPDVTVLPAGTIPAFINGTRYEEYIRTEGHHHKTNLPEVYENNFGQNIFLLFKVRHPKPEEDSAINETGYEEVEDVMAVFAKPGDHVLFPPGYQHITINIGNTPFVMTDWVSTNAESSFKYIKLHNGAPYWVVKGKDGRPEFIPNPRYKGKVPAIRLVKLVNEIFEFGLRKGKPMFNIVKEGNIRLLSFLNDTNESGQYDEIYRREFVPYRENESFDNSRAFGIPIPNVFPLAVPDGIGMQVGEEYDISFHIQDMILANVEAKGWDLLLWAPYPLAFWKKEHGETLAKRLKELKQIFDCYTTEWHGKFYYNFEISWSLVISLNLALTKGYIAADNLGQNISKEYPENTVFIHASFFRLVPDRQREILWYLLISRMRIGISSAQEALVHTLKCIAWVRPDELERRAKEREASKKIIEEAKARRISRPKTQTDQRDDKDISLDNGGKSSSPISNSNHSSSPLGHAFMPRWEEFIKGQCFTFRGWWGALLPFQRGVNNTSIQSVSSSPIEEEVTPSQIIEIYEYNHPTDTHGIEVIKNISRVATEEYAGMKFSDGEGYLRHASITAYHVAYLGGGALTVAISLLHKIKADRLKDILSTKL
ncbi:MAG: hypothetical protein KKE64_03210, partial [Candidatus Omnitrophica bacterium]|nr:hypothetical protein [Candidatus Omnitrophota bacterium]